MEYDSIRIAEQCQDILVTVLDRKNDPTDIIEKPKPPNGTMLKFEKIIAICGYWFISAGRAIDKQDD